MEPWEALDLDYSDVHSLLRPLKRHRSPQPLSPSSTATSTLSLPLLETCSLPPSKSQPRVDNLQSELSLSPQASLCRSQRISTGLEASCPSGASTRIIPGPAGAVQVAMQRRTRGDHSCVGDEEPVPTQEYIRRVMENGDEEDDDFNRSPWVCALDFVRSIGAMEGNGAVSETPLNSIKNGFIDEKVGLVVAIIKSCTSNGLGGMMVALKDPTGTIDASIHHRVISEGIFGKDLSVGAVLILQKVAVFSPTRSVHVLNVTRSNVVKVISKDSGPLIKHNSPTPIRWSDFITGDTHGEVHMQQMNSDVSRESTQNIMNNLRQSSKLRRNRLGDLRTGKGGAASSSNWNCNETVGSRQSVVEKEGGVIDVGISKRTPSVGCNIVYVDQDQGRGSDEPINHPMGTDSTKENGAASSTAQLPNNQEAETINEMKKTVTRTQQPLLPQWTDEQLDELFEFD
uniref:Homologous recombination OB-fold protein OB-fold domain-containing protein n=1 Tax=Cucumis melo TaxID=3656 RepID=A0A9I9DFT5_CUCME